MYSIFTICFPCFDIFCKFPIFTGTKSINFSQNNSYYVSLIISSFTKLSEKNDITIVHYIKYISVTGLQGLEALTELDLSYNCLTEHAGLWPLQKMSALVWISLEGNPLSYHPKHRILSLKYLHPSLSDNKVSNFIILIYLYIILIYYTLTIIIFILNRHKVHKKRL